MAGFAVVECVFLRSYFCLWDRAQVQIPTTSQTNSVMPHYSIRVNDQWRIMFKWDKGNASEVELLDCH